MVTLQNCNIVTLEMMKSLQIIRKFQVLFIIYKIVIRLLYKLENNFYHDMSFLKFIINL